MADNYSPRRSALFVPADNARALKKIGPKLPADCFIIDLEDAVSLANKSAARAALGPMLSNLDTGGRELLLRINASDSFDYIEDLALAATLPISAVVLPKVESPAQVQQLAQSLHPDQCVWAMIETAKGVLQAEAICESHPKLDAVMVGTQDLGLDLQLPPGAGRSPIIEHCLMQCLLAAKAAGIAAIDSVCPDFKNLETLSQECRDAAARGFNGKAAIHPAQLLPINACFSPELLQLDRARAICDAWRVAEEQGLSVASLDGRMIEHLHFIQAESLLNRARAIEKHQSGT